MPARGQDFYALMRDQRRRAAEFDRQLRWTVLRKDLSDVRSGHPSAAEQVVDLRPSEEQAGFPRQD